MKESESPARRDTSDHRPLLERILDTPQLAKVVPRLQPEILHRVIQNCGLEDSGELVALATPVQLARVFDLDLWRPAEPGKDDQFDADRFGVWLEVLVDAGVSVAAGKLAGMDVSLVIAGLAEHALVYDSAAVSGYSTTDGETVAATRTRLDGASCEVGGYLVVATRTGSWDAIAAVLSELEEEHHDYFHRLMRGCRSLSNSKPEADGFHDLLLQREQVMFDIAFDRERRREKQGYATPAQARAFLQMSRQPRLEHDVAPPANPLARAYFRAIEPAEEADTSEEDLAGDGLQTAPLDDAATAALADVIDILHGAGVLVSEPRALLAGPEGPAPRLALIQEHLQYVRDRNLAAYATRNEELAYLANVLLAGCSLQARPFTPPEASDAAIAICNLGLENWLLRSRPPSSDRLPDDFLLDRDLVSVFQTGWSVLYHDVCMYAAKQLVEVLRDIRVRDRETQAGINELRVEMKKHRKAGMPWLAEDALDVLAILDLPAWTTLLGLIRECPVIHEAIGASRGVRILSINASAFEFISENSQIAAVREFMDSLPEMLRP